MILTSNRGFAEWGNVWASRCRHCLLDRLLHHAVVIHIEGASYRLRQHADLIPDISVSAPLAASPRHRAAAAARQASIGPVRNS